MLLLLATMHSVLSAAAKSLQSCLTLCDPTDSSPPGSAAPGILQARTLEWVAISLSNAWKWKVKVKSLSHVWLFPTRWTSAYQAPLSMGFSRQEYWSGLPLPSPSVPSTVPFILQLDFFQNLVKELSFMIIPLTPPPKTKPGEHFSYPFLYLFLLKRWECVNIHLFLLKRWGC